MTDSAGATITRAFAARREVVFVAWTEPQHFAAWFGGSAVTVPIDSVEMDVRPGGTWKATMHLPGDLCGRLEGRSTWARQGLQVHATAGMVDAGFKGYLTLELQNTGRVPLVLYPGLRVAQMAFHPVTMTEEAHDVVITTNPVLMMAKAPLFAKLRLRAATTTRMTMSIRFK